MNERDKMDEQARKVAMARRAELDRLLAERPDRLTRGWPGLTKTDGVGVTPASAAQLERLLAESDWAEGPRGRVRRWTTRIAVETPGGGPVAIHERGYAFLPVARRPAYSVAYVAESFELLGVDFIPMRGEAGWRPSLRDLLFLDTETTGVMGSTGTVAFLVGLGWFEGETDADGQMQPREFVVEQLFIDDFCGEEALLALVAERIAASEALVTYNGRGYDMPLLEGRFVMNRMRPAAARPHLDLLHPARAVFRAAVGSCSLRNIERNVLGIARTHDVDGALIPQIFFDYVRGTRRERMVPVVDHNVQDIVSLGALLLDLGDRMSDAQEPSFEGQAAMAAGFGKLLRRRGQGERSVAFFERAVAESRDANLTRSCLAALADLYRRGGRAEEAAEIWRNEWKRRGTRDPEACMQLVKVYERHLGDAAAALELVRDAERQSKLSMDLGALTGSSGGAKPPVDFKEWLVRRRLRLERKLEKAAPRQKKRDKGTG
jgi:hypothetical protein